MNDRQVHSDLLSQVERDKATQAEIRRILTAPLTEADLDARIAGKFSTWPNCCGACDQGRKLCSAPEACQRSEQRPLPERGDLYRVLAMATWPLYAVALGAFFAWLML